MNKIEFHQDMFEAMSHEIKALKTKATAYELQLIDVLEDLNQYCKEDCEYGETCVPTANSCKILKIRTSIRLGG